ncbi:MAG TPA: hypothetical protein VNU26_18460 [Mycobacteriales bacterium]|nr:hypothetical protein [Mycobacteriales bacterium]
MDLETPVREGFTTVATFVPKLIGALLILVIGYFLATLVAKLVDRVLERVGFDRAVEKGGIKKALAKSSYDASDVVAKLVFFALFIPVLSGAVSALGIQALEEPLAAFIALIPKIIVAIVLVVLGAVVAGAVKSFIVDALGGLSYANALATGAAVLVLFGFVKAALDQVGVATDVTGPVLYAMLATAAGVVIVGVGGGLIRPMQRRWDEWLDKAADEKDKIKNRAQSSAPAYPADPAPPTAAYPAGTDAGGAETATMHEQRPL